MTDPQAIYEQADRRSKPRGHTLEQLNQLYIDGRIANEWHKGEPCPYKPGTRCAEGFCFRCQIYIDAKGEL